MSDVSDLVRQLETQRNHLAGLVMARTGAPALIEGLEKIRKRLCHYGPAAQTCDCKYGASFKGEQSGCPEIRQAIDALSLPEKDES